METLKGNGEDYIKSFFDAIPPETVEGMKLKDYIDVLQDPNSFAYKFNIVRLSIYAYGGYPPLLSIQNPADKNNCKIIIREDVYGNINDNDINSIMNSTIVLYTNFIFKGENGKDENWPYVQCSAKFDEDYKIKPLKVKIDLKGNMQIDEV